MADAFKAGAEEAGNEVCMLHVGRMKIGGCLGCEYCHGKGQGECIQKDDMGQVIDAYKWADMVVFASPIYYSTMTSQLHAAIQRMYCIGKPATAKAALLLSTASGQTNAAEAYFKQLTAFMGMENCGVCKVVGEDNKKEEKMAEIKAWAATRCHEKGRFHCFSCQMQVGACAEINDSVKPVYLFWRCAGLLLRSI